MGLTIGDVMVRDVQTLDPNMTLTEMDRVLLAGSLGGAPVVEDGRLVGIVSRSDVIRVLYDEQVRAQEVSGFYRSPFPIPIPALERLAKDSREIADRMTKLRVREVMTPDPKTVSPSDEVETVARLMWTEEFHRVPVMDGDRLVGVVTSLDLVRLIGELGLRGSS